MTRMKEPEAKKDSFMGAAALGLALTLAAGPASALPGSSDSSWASSLDAISANVRVSAAGVRRAAVAAAAKAPARAVSIDLNGQFPPNKPHDQGHIGSCHDFAAVALVEAAYYRRYKVHLALSEADMFAQGQIKSGKVCSESSISQSANGALSCSLGEGGDEIEDVEYILKSGILPQGVNACAEYSQFSKNYIKDFQRPVQRALLQQEKAGVARTSWDDLSSDQLGAAAQRLINAAPDADGKRAALAQALTGFKLVSQTFGFKDYNDLRALSPKQCAMFGRPAASFILGELKAGRPVVLGFELRGLKDWHCSIGDPHSSPTGLDGHAFLITGFDNAGGRPVFHTRNSWTRPRGPNKGQQINPDIYPDELCRVVDAGSLLTPDEAAKAHIGSMRVAGNEVGPYGARRR